MGDDLSTGAKIGIGLVILCFLIAIVLSLLMVVKNITNSGANQMEGGLNQMMQTTYDDYDQTVVSGTKVKSALKLFQGENIAIVIDSNFEKQEGQHVYNYGLLLQDVAGSNVSTAANQYVTGDDNGKAYGEVFKVDNVSYANDAHFNADGVSVRCTTRDGAAKFNLNTRPVEASGKDTYVRDNAKYQSYLIRDRTDTIVGLYFKLSTT